MLDHVRLPDNIVAQIIYELSHTRSAQKGETARSFVNYRDMSVQQLGSIYERLLEQEPVRGDDGDIAMRPNPYARKDSGSFYTPQELVDLIVEKTLDPLVEERLAAFEQKAARLKRDRRPKAARQQELAALDPAAAVLDLKILDPAMGSGHFLVTAVDFLSDYIADLVEYAPGVPDWLADDPGAAYVSPLVARIAAIRQEILLRARESDWTLNEEQLTDQAIIRRMVLKRCIYGVDKNPLAVELAKVSLWLHSFTVGAPLSFLDHHLRCGDSLLGMRVTEAVGELRRMGSFFIQSAVAGAEASAEGMEHIEMLSDADVSEVRQSASLFKEVEETTSDLRGLLDTLCGLRWLTAGMKKRERTLFELPLLETLDKHAVDAFKLLAHGPDVLDNRQTDAVRHSDESRNPGFQPGVSDSDRPSPAGDTVRHSGESRNPSSSAAASSGSAGLQPAPTERKELATGVSEGQAPALPHRSDASDAVRHSRASVDARPTGERSDARPTGERIDARPTSERIDARPTGESVDARPTGESVDARPTSESIDARPTSESIDARPTGESIDARPTGESVDARHSRESVDARHSRESVDARPTGASVDARHSRESGNPSSSESLDSGFHRSDDPQAAPSSGSAGLQPASEEGNDPAADTSGETLTQEFANLWRDARAIADRETFLHWEAAFPGVWAQWQDANPSGGFDAVIGNPPWDRIKLQEVEWFATRAPELARAPTAAARRTAIKELRAQGDPLAADFDDAKARADSLGKLVRASGHYPLLGGGDVNLYSLFVERALHLVNANGLVGLLTPSGIYADKTAAKFFKSVSTRGRVAGLFDFENRRLGTDLPPFFPDVDSRFKFCALIVGGAARQFDETACAFFLHDKKTTEDPERCFPLAPDDFARVNPNTGTAPVFRTRRDADITRAVYARHPVLVNRSSGTEHKTWPVKYVRMFDMTNDSHLFRTAARLDAEGFYPVKGNRWQRGKELYLPLYEGKMVQAFDHRAASVVVNPENLNRPAQPREATLGEHAEPKWLPDPQFWVGAGSLDHPEELGWTLAFKHVTAPTNVRTMIACIAPRAGFGNSLPVFLPTQKTSEAVQAYKTDCYLLAANLNVFAFDFVTRQKVQGQNLNLFLVEQLPVIAPADYDRKFGDTTARDLVRDHVLKLTYTAHDMAPFARDLGHVGPPFIWDEEKRRHLRARLDALYFHLYGISREDADYILSTFPIVQRQDQAAYGRYRTRNLILAYMNALTAGDTETVVNL